MTQVAVIVVNFNTGADAVACAASAAADLASVPHEIIVVDNASSDDSVERLRSHPVCAVIVNQTNPGFGAAINQATRTTDAALLWILNPDCRVEPGAIATLLSHTRHPCGLRDRGATVAERGRQRPGQRARRAGCLDGPLRPAFAADQVFPARRSARRNLPAADLVASGVDSAPVDWVMGAAIARARDPSIVSAASTSATSSTGRTPTSAVDSATQLDARATCRAPASAIPAAPARRRRRVSPRARSTTPRIDTTQPTWCRRHCTRPLLVCQGCARSARLVAGPLIHVPRSRNAAAVQALRAEPQRRRRQVARAGDAACRRPRAPREIPGRCAKCRPRVGRGVGGARRPQRLRQEHAAEDDRRHSPANRRTDAGRRGPASAA